MSFSQLRGPCFRKTLEGKFADRLQHNKMKFVGVLSQQAVIQQRRYSVEHAHPGFTKANRLRSLERKAANKNRKLSKETLLFLIEKVIAPGDRSAHGFLAHRQFCGSSC